MILCRTASLERVDNFGEGHSGKTSSYCSTIPERRVDLVFMEIPSPAKTVIGGMYFVVTLELSGVFRVI